MLNLSEKHSMIRMIAEKIANEKVAPRAKEIDATDSAIVNPLDAMPYLQMETMREYSYQRFLNELYKRKKF